MNSLPLFLTASKASALTGGEAADLTASAWHVRPYFSAAMAAS